MAKSVKSGKEILDNFFGSISKIDKVDTKIAEMLNDLYKKGKLTDINVKNELQNLRKPDGNKN
jgi:hypothetical protein